MSDARSPETRIKHRDRESPEFRHKNFANHLGIPRIQLAVSRTAQRRFKGDSSGRVNGENWSKRDLSV